MPSFLLLMAGVLCPDQSAGVAQAFQQALQQANTQKGWRVVEPPRTLEQFRINLALKYPLINGEAGVVWLFDAYLDRKPWPELAQSKPKENPQVQAIPPGAPPVVLQNGKAKPAKAPPELIDLMRSLTYKKHRNPKGLSSEDQLRLNVYISRLSPKESDLEKESEFLKKAEEGRINQYLDSEISNKNGQIFFKTVAAKNASIAGEKELIGEIKTKLEKAKEEPPPTNYTNPWKASYKPKDLAEYRQAYDEAEFWYQHGYPIPYLPPSLVSDLLENRNQKKLAYEEAKAKGIK